MKLSEEQSEIIKVSQQLREGEILKIDACAGSGKTSTLVEIVKANPRKEFLYLAFNRSIADKAGSIFPSNCVAMTIHSLAFRHLFHRQKPFLGNIKVSDLREHFSLLNNYKLYELLMQYKAFLNSDEDVIPTRGIQRIFNLVNEGKLPCMHDHYLKIFEMMSPKEQGLSDQFDCILIDESQDANPVMLNIIRKASCSKIFVGDSHQSIYGFRGAINALASQKASVVKHLSISFRSTQEVLDKANLYVSFFNNEVYEGQVPYIHMKCHSQTVELRNEQHAIITRTNSKLVDIIAEYMDTPEEALLLKRPDDVFKMPIALYEFMHKRKRDFFGDLAFLNDFKNKDELEDYAEETGDNEINVAIRIADKYKKMLYVMKNKAAMMNSPKAPVVLTNAHTSKGLEWKSVQIEDDFPDLGDVYARCYLAPVEDAELMESLPLVERRSIVFYDFLQELNLYYVAITRAQVEVTDLSDNGKYDNEEELSKHRDTCMAKHIKIMRA